jgi:putative resolvase
VTYVGTIPAAPAFASVGEATEMARSAHKTALTAHNRLPVVFDDYEVTEDLVADMVEVLTWFCASLYGRRSAWIRALKALSCAQQDIGPGTAAG